MGLLLCNNDGCAYNYSDKCMTTILEIGEKGQCKSFQEGATVKRLRDAEFAAELGIEGRDIDNVIDCTAECVFNKHTHCHAGSVNMNDGLFQTRCKTRIKD